VFLLAALTVFLIALAIGWLVLPSRVTCSMQETLTSKRLPQDEYWSLLSRGHSMQFVTKDHSTISVVSPD